MTAGDVERLQGYLVRAGVDMPVESFTSCDDLGVSKPALKAYEAVVKEFKEGDQKWFAAAHMCDVSAACCVGFRGAYCSIYEKEAWSELFGGDVEVMTASITKLVRKVIEESQ